MIDLVFVAVSFIFFAVSVAYAAGCASLKGGGPNA